MSYTPRTGLNTRDVMNYGFHILFTGAHCNSNRFYAGAVTQAILQLLANHIPRTKRSCYAYSTFGVQYRISSFSDYQKNEKKTVQTLLQLWSFVLVHSS